MSGCSIWSLVLDDNFFVLLLGGISTNHCYRYHLTFYNQDQDNPTTFQSFMEGTNNLSSFTSNPFVVILCSILLQYFCQFGFLYEVKVAQN